jgi:hypothetical protein
MTKHLNPASALVAIARKQRVGEEDASLIGLPVLIHLDAAKRGQGPAAGQQFLYQHLIMASFIASRTQSKAFHAAVVAAVDALMKASKRPTKLLDLTTSEYTALRTAFSWYLRALPSLEVGLLNDACTVTERFISKSAA